jgi:hypothetical protein
MKHVMELFKRTFTLCISAPYTAKDRQQNVERLEIRLIVT